MSLKKYKWFKRSVELITVLATITFAILWILNPEDQLYEPITLALTAASTLVIIIFEVLVDPNPIENENPSPLQVELIKEIIGITFNGQQDDTDPEFSILISLRLSASKSAILIENIEGVYHVDGCPVSNRESILKINGEIKELDGQHLKNNILIESNSTVTIDYKRHCRGRFTFENGHACENGSYKILINYRLEDTVKMMEEIMWFNYNYYAGYTLANGETEVPYLSNKLVDKKFKWRQIDKKTYAFIKGFSECERYSLIKKYEAKQFANRVEEYSGKRLSEIAGRINKTSIIRFILNAIANLNLRAF